MPACYQKMNGDLLSNDNWQSIISPCGPVNDTNKVVPCCYNGDYCMSDGICHYTHSLVGGSGYYVAGCTDPYFSDPVSQNRCCRLNRFELEVELEMLMRAIQTATEAHPDDVYLSSTEAEW